MHFIYPKLIESFILIVLLCNISTITSKRNYLLCTQRINIFLSYLHRYDINITQVLPVVGIKHKVAGCHWCIKYISAASLCDTYKIDSLWKLMPPCTTPGHLVWNTSVVTRGSLETHFQNTRQQFRRLYNLTCSIAESTWCCPRGC